MEGRHVTTTPHPLTPALYQTELPRANSQAGFEPATSGYSLTKRKEQELNLQGLRSLGFEPSPVANRVALPREAAARRISLAIEFPQAGTAKL